MLLRISLAILVVLGTYSGSQAAETLQILPAEIQLTGRAAKQRLVVERLQEGALSGECDSVVWSSDPAGIVEIRDGVLHPLANGQTRLTATADGQTTTTEVTIAGQDQPQDWSFRNHVLPVLSKSGCNSGACHGALAGKGGFRLSLHGYDPLSDYHNITKQARARRVELTRPGQSLLLTKPSGAIPHKGGLRFETDSENYRVLADWIAAGAPEPKADDVKLERLEVVPTSVLLQPGATQQILVRAWYSDGHSEDVTRWAKYTSTNEAVASINDQGRLTVTGAGEGAITAWFSSRIGTSRVSVPYTNTLPPDVYTNAARHNFIDDLVLAKLERLRLPPSPLASDAEFLRRASLDTIGTLPTPTEVREFLADTAPDKRDQLIEKLLARPEFVDYWTYKWSDLLLINGQRLRPAAVKAYYLWVHDQVAANTPWDEFVRKIVTAQGSSFDNGATNFYALHQDPETLTENVCQAFLGLSIGCAKCHNHPLEKWTNNQYYGMANLFARVRAKGWGGDFRSGDGARTVYVVSTGDLIQPLTGRAQPPTPLDAQPLSFDSPEDRRIYLAQWLTAPENPYFTRAIANRIWANFLGVGLVESVDDLRISNPASNEELLEACSQFLIEHKYDLKQLMRVILQSATYQRSSQTVPGNETDQRFYARYYPRRMMAEVLLDAISQITDVPSDFNEIAFPGGDKTKTDFYPKGTRALQLYDSAVASTFLKAFGRNQREITCECERSDEPSMVQVLHISNGNTINQKLKAAGNRLEQQLQANLSDTQMIEEAYLSVLGRDPTPIEQQKILAVITEDPTVDRRTLWEDLYWGLLSSREFLFNH